MLSLIQNLIDALSLGSLYALVALGIGLLFGILRLINIAHGDFVTVGAYSLIFPATDAATRLLIGAWDWWELVPAVCIIVVICALLTDLLVFRQLRRASAPTLMIASFGVSYLIQNGILLIYGSRPKAIDLWPALNQQIIVGSLRLPTLQLITIAITLVLMLALTLFLNRTAYGVQMRAAAEDFRMSQYLGVRSDAVIALAFGISGLLAAAVALLYVARSGSATSQMGAPLALYAFVSVVIGGMGSLPGAVLGGFLVGFILSFLQAYLPIDVRDLRDAFAFVIVVLVLLVRPNGLIPGKGEAKRV
jgi:branched-chain amino acid transport system permease protein